MNRFKFLVMILFAVSIGSTSIKAQVSDPDFIGEAYQLKNDGSTVQLDKEIADYTAGISFSSNTMNALSMEIPGGKAQIRVPYGDPLKIVVKALDNNSDPLTIISIYKLKAKARKRTVVLSKNNTGTLMKSKTNSKAMVRFSGKKIGTSSYLIELNNLKPGEYSIVVSNPNNRDEKRTVISCFGIS